MFFLLLIPLVITYILIMARLEPKFSRISAAKCDNCSKGEVYYSSYYRMDLEPGDKHECFLQALFWPVTALYIFTHAKNDPAVKRGMRAIDDYWDDKAAIEFAKRTERLEKELKIGQPQIKLSEPNNKRRILSRY